MLTAQPRLKNKLTTYANYILNGTVGNQTEKDYAALNSHLLLPTYSTQQTGSNNRALNTPEYHLKSGDIELEQFHWQLDRAGMCWAGLGTESKDDDDDDDDHGLAASSTGHKTSLQ